MKIAINDLELTFRKCDAEQFKTKWTATLLYAPYELDFEFDESLFFDKKSNEIKIDWKLIEEFVLHIIKNLDLIQSKGISVLEELHKQVFGKEELLKTEGYFQTGGVELKRYRKEEYTTTYYHFAYDVHYFLESRKNFEMDSYHSYQAQFSSHNGLTICGVSRFGS
ncbi:hypothetical protein [Pedobacter caeni]|uniref:Uncharacterized protein n=1 Tax=Pedobacter caeni TaxID=288992 RepID=A0A1M5DR99_9SPHI|nr:hypothetical protein [Pedobacter caeni]SHF69517.1 hypothetical protein SAMN04488522_103351 [Pedobacter caeni]